MATPVGFEGANKVYGAPKGMENCRDLECFIHENETFSCWRLSDEELAEVARTGVVWVSIVGHPIPPSYVSGKALVEIAGVPAKADPIVPIARNGGTL